MKSSRFEIAALAFSFLFVCGLSFVGASKDALTPRGKKRIGLVFDVGGLGDKSFNDATYQGLMKAKEDFDIEVQYLEPSSSEDREAALRLFASRTYDLVLGVGFIFSSDIDSVARDYPKVHFACVDYAPQGSEIPKNVAALAFKEEEGSFLVGALSGLLSASRKVGFVGGMQGPLIKKFEKGYVFGLSQTCPSCTVFTGYVGTTPDAYRDPAKGKSLASTQISSGADILYHASGATGVGVFQAAKEGHALAIGVDVDQFDAMPEVVLTSMLKRADRAVYDVIKSEVQNEFHSGFRVFGLKEEGVDYVHEGPHASRISDEIKGKIAALKLKVISGEIVVPRE